MAYKEILGNILGVARKTKEFIRPDNIQWKLDLIREWEKSPKTKAKGVVVVRNSKGEPIWANTKNHMWNIVLDENSTEQTTTEDFPSWMRDHFKKGTSFALLYTNIDIQLIHAKDNPRKNFCVLRGIPINLRNIGE